MPLLRAAALFTLLAAAMTWPQVRDLATHASDHQDVYFNMWRMGWVAHALSSPARLFDGNIFHPEPSVLTFSDGLLVESTLAAPLLRAGLPPVLVHNLALLAGIVLSACGAFLLARRLTGSTAGSILAGVIFAFAPYRFDHYAHMELQWAMWIPLAFWSLDRTVESGRWQDGLLTGVLIALQFMSSIYYGVYLATLLAIVAALLLVGRRQHWKRAGASLALGAAVGAALCLPYATPYIETKEALGGRSRGEVATYSARGRDYLMATPENYLYGPGSARRGRSERRLFPGAVAALLALTALLVSRPPVTVLVYLIGLVAAVDMSLGVRGHTYPFLFEHVPGFDSLRSPARLGIFVLFFLAILAAHGYAAIERALRPRLRTAMAIGTCAVVLLEYWVGPQRLVPYPNEAPPLYAWLAGQPRGLVAEFPLPVAEGLPGDDPRYSYLSTFHWMPLVNGYSGYYPRSYLTRLDNLLDFPDERATDVLRQAGVRYVIIHRVSYAPDRAAAMLDAIEGNPAYVAAGRFDDGRGEAAVFRLR